MTFKEWTVECQVCMREWKEFKWNTEFPSACIWCSSVGSVNPVNKSPSQTVMIATDSLPGGYEIRHGLCNDDGTPRKYYSKTEIKQEANRRGYTIGGDTPKPYKVNWEGKRD